MNVPAPSRGPRSGRSGAVGGRGGMDSHEPRRPFQFGLATMLGIMVLVSLLASAAAGMMRQRTTGAPLPTGFYIVMAMAAPMGVMILVGVFHAVCRLLKSRRR